MNEMIKAINDLENGQKNAVRTSAPQRAPEPAKFTQEQMRSTDDGSRTITPKPEKEASLTNEQIIHPLTSR